MLLEERYLEQAKRLHREYPAADTHLDLAGEIYFRIRNGEQDPLRTHYLKPFREGGFNLIVSSVFLENDQVKEDSLAIALEQIRMLKEEIAKNEEFCLVCTAAQLEEAIREDRIAVILYMEGLDCIGSVTGLLQKLWDLGVRGASLTWSRQNALATGCCEARQRIDIPGRLTPYGIQAVREMERLGMFLDISHLNDEGFEDIAALAAGSFIATHSNSRNVFFNYRCLTDDQMKKLAASGGIMGLNGCKVIVGCVNGEDPIEMMCRHIEYETALIGSDHVGYGFDFCDSFFEAETRQSAEGRRGDCLRDHGCVPQLTAALLQRGMPEEDVKKIIGGNWVRYFGSVLPQA